MPIFHHVRLGININGFLRPIPRLSLPHQIFHLAPIPHFRQGPSSMTSTTPLFPFSSTVLPKACPTSKTSGHTLRVSLCATHPNSRPAISSHSLEQCTYRFFCIPPSNPSASNRSQTSSTRAAPPAGKQSSQNASGQVWHAKSSPPAAVRVLSQLPQRWCAQERKFVGETPPAQTECTATGQTGHRMSSPPSPQIWQKSWWSWVLDLRLEEGSAEPRVRPRSSRWSAVGSPFSRP
mmetsp:Transcript_7866/g.19547  ORF Transcript_7866/g.19547 Transcript_7866/m.19547 type:complete len:235 (+) Transcript_7866:191-895(+)